MGERDTGVTCLACKQGTIIAEVNSVATVPIEMMPIGPGSSSYYYRKVTFHCSHCQALVCHPPGRPNATQEVLDEIDRENQPRPRGVFDDMSLEEQEQFRRDIEEALEKSKIPE